MVIFFYSRNEANILLSGGQDGIIKLIDFRSPADNITFKHDAEDKVIIFIYIFNYFLK
jgi:hypothetical protein